MCKLFVPTYHVSSIFEIKPESLKNKGIKLILTDLDNTLDNYKDKEPSQRVIDKVKDFKDAGLEILIISNNYKERVSTYAKKAGLEMMSFMMKPCARRINKLIYDKGYQKSEVVMIGDQLFTDIAAGNNAKVMSILVDKLTPLDQPFTRVKRILEKPLMKRMKKKNLIKEWED